MGINHRVWSGLFGFHIEALGSGRDEKGRFLICFIAQYFTRSYLAHVFSDDINENFILKIHTLKDGL